MASAPVKEDASLTSTPIFLVIAVVLQIGFSYHQNGILVMHHERLQQLEGRLQNQNTELGSCTYRLKRLEDMMANMKASSSPTPTKLFNLRPVIWEQDEDDASQRASSASARRQGQQDRSTGQRAMTERSSAYPLSDRQQQVSVATCPSESNDMYTVLCYETWHSSSWKQPKSTYVLVTSTRFDLHPFGIANGIRELEHSALDVLFVMSKRQNGEIFPRPEKVAKGDMANDASLFVRAGLITRAIKEIKAIPGKPQNYLPLDDVILHALKSAAVHHYKMAHFNQEMSIVATERAPGLQLT